jgi:hypothetical protein
MAIKRVTVVLLLQAEFCNNEQYTALAPLLREVLQLVKKAAQMTDTCKGLKFDTEDAWYDAVTFFDDEIMTKKAIWRLLKQQYDDPDLTKELYKEWKVQCSKWTDEDA